MKWIEVETRPKPKERPRFNTLNRVTYTPKATQDYEDRIAWEYKWQDGTLHTGAVALYCKFYFKSKKASGLHTSVPDTDNLLKAIMDGLNGVAWEDDSQVAIIDARKLYGDRDLVRIMVEGLDE